MHCVGFIHAATHVHYCKDARFVATPRSIDGKVLVSSEPAVATVQIHLEQL